MLKQVVNGALASCRVLCSEPNEGLQVNNIIFRGNSSRHIA